MGGSGLFIGELCEQFGEGGFVVDVAVAYESLNVHFAVFEEIHFPIFSRSANDYGYGAFAVIGELMRNLRVFQPTHKGKQFIESVLAHFLNLPSVSNFRNV
jgi:hypothetical protein